METIKLDEKEIKIGKGFKILKKLGRGSFGQIFHGINLKTNMEVALKLESIKSDNPQLLYECKLY